MIPRSLTFSISIFNYPHILLKNVLGPTFLVGLLPPSTATVHVTSYYKHYNHEQQSIHSQWVSLYHYWKWNLTWIINCWCLLCDTQSCYISTFIIVDVPLKCDERTTNDCLMVYFIMVNKELVGVLDGSTKSQWKIISFLKIENYLGIVSIKFFFYFCFWIN